MKKYYKLFLLNILIVFILLFLSELWIKEPLDHTLVDNFEKHPLLYSLFIVLVAPITEELIFRFPLKYNKLNLIAAIAVLSIILSSSYLLIQITSGVYLLGLLIQRFLKKDTLFIILASCLAFAVLHLGNYNELHQSLWKNLLLVLPQFILGGIISYIRLKDNTKTAMLYHSCYNLFILLFFLMGLWLSKV